MSVPVDEQEVFVLPEQDEAAFARILERYPTSQSALMPTLWLIQDRCGHVPPAAVPWICDKLSVTRARVAEVISFYTMFRDAPQARYVLQVCHNISCAINGARSIIAHLEKRLGIRMGQTTPDGMFAIEGVECLGACGMGPVIQIGKHFYEELTPEKVDALLDSLRRGAPMRPDTDRELED